MDIVLRIMRHIVVDDQRHICHIDAAGNHIGGYQHVYLSVPEIEHHLVAFVLLQVRMHGMRVDLQAAQRAREIFDPLFLAGEDDHFL